MSHHLAWAVASCSSGPPAAKTVKPMSTGGVYRPDGSPCKTASFSQLTELENRHREFLKLEECLVEVNSMFVELSDLVAQQGDMVDSIEANVSNAKEYVSFFIQAYIK